MLGGRSHAVWFIGLSIYMHFEGLILFANHKANGVVTNIGLLANTVDDTGSYMAG